LTYANLNYFTGYTVETLRAVWIRILPVRHFKVARQRKQAFANFTVADSNEEDTAA